MLTDTERKILRIIWNRNRADASFISIPLYARMSGRREGQVLRALTSLAEKSVIEWDPTFKRVQVINTMLLTGPPQKATSSPAVKPW